MNAALDCSDGNDGRVTFMVTSGVGDRVESKVGDGSVERCEPFNVGEGMLQGTKLLGKLEDDLDASDSDT